MWEFLAGGGIFLVMMAVPPLVIGIRDWWDNIRYERQERETQDILREQGYDIPFNPGPDWRHLIREQDRARRQAEIQAKRQETRPVRTSRLRIHPPGR